MLYNKVLMSPNPNSFDGSESGGTTPNIIEGSDFKVELVPTTQQYVNISNKIASTAYFIPEIGKIIVDNIAYGFDESDITPELLSGLLAGDSSNTAIASISHNDSEVTVSVSVKISDKSVTSELTWELSSSGSVVGVFQDPAISGEQAFVDWLNLNVTTGYTLGQKVKGSDTGEVKAWGTTESSGKNIVTTISDELFDSFTAFRDYILERDGDPGTESDEFALTNYLVGQEVRGYKSTDPSTVYYIAVVDTADYYYAEVESVGTTNENLIKIESDGLFVDKADIQTLIDASTGYDFATDGTVKDVIDAIDAELGAIQDDIANNTILTSDYLFDTEDKIKSGFLPSYVDDVKEGYYDSGTDAFYEEDTFNTVIPAETGKIYVNKPNNVSYRYTGSTYIDISNPNLVNLNNSDGTAYDLVSSDLFIATINGTPVLGTSSQNLSICQWTVVT